MPYSFETIYFSKDFLFSTCMFFYHSVSAYLKLNFSLILSPSLDLLNLLSWYHNSSHSSLNLGFLPLFPTLSI